MAFKDLSLPDRLVAVHTDMLRHADFCILGSVSQVGNVIIDDLLPTAGTDGVNVHYNPDFIHDMSRKQLRYLVAHEQAHRAFRHCTEYRHIKAKYPDEFAQAIDYVVNWQIEQLDTKGDFLERPTSVPPLVNAKYANMGVLEIIRDLLQNPPPQGSPKPQPMDVHMDPPDDAKEGEGEGEEEGAAGKKSAAAEIAKALQDAVLQGEIVQQQLRKERGDMAGGASLSGFRERITDWRGPLRRFVTEACEGDEHSRFNPPARRFLPLGILMPSHYSEAAKELVIAPDTSGSMYDVLPLVFGEVARICQSVMPAKVRVLWWDTKVQSEQVFEPKDYAQIAKLMAPKGGGGTTVSCVAQYMRAKNIKPTATIMLTDGYVESQYEVVAGNVLWGVVGNTAFRPVRGKVLHIQEA